MLKEWLNMYTLYSVHHVRDSLHNINLHVLKTCLKSEL